MRSLQVASRAGDGAASADANHEMRDTAVRLVPDLGSCLLVVRGRVRQVVVLIRLPAVRILLLESRRDRVIGPRVLRIDVRRADDDLGAEGLQRVDLLLRLFVGRREDALVAFDHGGDCQAHAGIARGPLDNRSARLQEPPALGVLDHPDGHPILDGVAWIERLDLGQHRGIDDTLGDSVDSHHRCVADGLEDGAADLVHVKIMSHCQAFETNLNPDADDVHAAPQIGSRASVPMFLSLEDWMSRLGVATVTLAVLLAASGTDAQTRGVREAISLHPENPHYFLWRGRPTILITSAEHYGAVLNLDFDFRRYRIRSLPRA